VGEKRYISVGREGIFSHQYTSCGNSTKLRAIKTHEFPSSFWLHYIQKYSSTERWFGLRGFVGRYMIFQNSRDLAYSAAHVLTGPKSLVDAVVYGSGRMPWVTKSLRLWEISMFRRALP